MALELIDGSIFLHLPRTGGTFVTAVLRRLGLVKRAVGNKHDCPGVIPMNMRVRHYVFIRHPYDWIRSVYAYQAESDWPTWPKQKECRWWHPFREINNPPEEAKRDFGAFLHWITFQHAGFASRIFTHFADWPCSYIARTDRMGDGLCDIVAQFGVSGSQYADAAYKAMRSRNSFQMDQEPSEEVLAAFLKSEQTAIQRWFYGER